MLHAMGSRVCCLYAWGDVVAYRLCYMILASLSGDPRCTSWLWVVLSIIFFFAISAPWYVGFLSTFHPGVFNAAFQPGAPLPGCFCCSCVVFPCLAWV